MINPTYQLGHHGFIANNSGWTCPRCQNVYAPCMIECINCNKKQIPLSAHHNAKDILTDDWEKKENPLC